MGGRRICRVGDSKVVGVGEQQVYEGEVSIDAQEQDRKA